MANDVAEMTIQLHMRLNKLEGTVSHLLEAMQGQQNQLGVLTRNNETVVAALNKMMGAQNAGEQKREEGPGSDGEVLREEKG